MITVYTDKEYAKSYTELLEILKYFPKSDLVKIPKPIIFRYIENMDINYNFSYNPDLDLNSQNISNLTKVLIANLYIDYIADKEESSYIKNKDLQELNKFDKEMKKIYDINTIFKKRKF